MNKRTQKRERAAGVDTGRDPRSRIYSRQPQKAVHEQVQGESASKEGAAAVRERRHRLCGKRNYGD